MRVPRNTHLSFIRSVRADFPRHVSASVQPVPVESAPEIVEAVSPVSEPVEAVSEPVAVVAEQPVTPPPPVKKTRKRKASA